MYTDVLASNGLGTNGATYPNDFEPREVLVQFLGNQRQQVFTIDINRDNANEGAETFTLSLSKVSGTGKINEGADVATVTIQDQEGNLLMLLSPSRQITCD